LVIHLFFNSWLGISFNSNLSELIGAYTHKNTNSINLMNSSPYLQILSHINMSTLKEISSFH